MAESVRNEIRASSYLLWRVPVKRPFDGFFNRPALPLRGGFAKPPKADAPAIFRSGQSFGGAEGPTQSISFWRSAIVTAWARFCAPILA